jgi:Zn-dependent M28 family amino/carboxypeptidase
MSGGVSGSTSGDLSGASDDRVTAAELAAMRQVAKDLAFKPTYVRACALSRTCSSESNIMRVAIR